MYLEDYVIVKVNNVKYFGFLFETIIRAICDVVFSE